MDSEETDLRQQLTALAERVERLEETARSADAPAALQPGDTERFWALNALQAQRTHHPSTEQGIVMLTGSLTLPGGSPVAWQQSAATATLLETDWSELAAAFAALGHPVRLELVRQILSGVHTTAELASIAGLGTTGQLHHHLRQLLSAGWVKQSGRGSYEVPVARVVPLLTALTGVQG